jgi:putative ABC transport system ATP-binding protein
MGEAVLIARGLTKDYIMGEVVGHALAAVDLDFYGGEFVVLLGPTGGSACWRDHDLSRASESELTRCRYPRVHCSARAHSGWYSPLQRMGALGKRL